MLKRQTDSLYNIVNEDKYPLSHIKFETGKFMLANSQLILSQGSEYEDDIECQRFPGSTNDFPITHVSIKADITFDRMTSNSDKNISSAVVLNRTK